MKQKEANYSGHKPFHLVRSQVSYYMCGNYGNKSEELL